MVCSMLGLCMYFANAEQLFHIHVVTFPTRPTTTTLWFGPSAVKVLTPPQACKVLLSGPSRSCGGGNLATCGGGWCKYRGADLSLEACTTNVWKV